MAMLINIGILLTLAVCMWNGWRRGLIMSLSNVLIIIIALVAGGVAAARFAPDFAGMVEPYIGWLSDDAVDEAMEEGGYLTDPRDALEIEEIAYSAFSKLGVSSDAAAAFASLVAESAGAPDFTLRTGVSRVAVSAGLYLMVFMVAFAIIAMALSVIAGVVASSFDLPILNMFNKIGGISLGFLYALFIIFTAAWFLRFTGIFISQDELAGSGLIQFFMRVNPVKGILGL